MNTEERLTRIGDYLADVDRARAGRARALDLLADTGGTVVLVCHVNPDGDAIGSMLGLGLGLAERGRSVVATVPGGIALPSTLRFLPGQELLTPFEQLPKNPDLVVALDSSSPDRLAEVAEYALAAPELVVIDHHHAGQEYGSARYIEPEAAATGMLVFDILDDLDCGKDGARARDIAMLLYTAIVTDTGGFAFSSVTSDVFDAAADLVSRGADPARVYTEVYGAYSFASQQILGRALARAELDLDAFGGNGVCWTYTTVQDLEAVGGDSDPLERVVGVLRTTNEADVAVVAKQFAADVTKMSLRSDGAVDVSVIAQEFGGGGHKAAAGYTFAGPALDAIAALAQLWSR